MSAGRSPAVLHLPLDGLSVLVQIHGHQCHGVRASAVEGLYALLLGHAERGAQKTFIIEVLEVEHTRVAVHELAYIAAEVHLCAVFQAGYGQRLEFLNVQIDIEPVVSVIDMAVIVNFIHLVIGTAGVVHEHDKVGIQVFALGTHFAIEFLRCIGLGLANGLAVLHGRPGKLLGRFAVSQHQQTVNGLQLLHLHGLQFLLIGSGLALLAQQDAELAQLSFQVSAELVGAVADKGFCHYILGNQAIFCHQVGHASIGSAVRKGVLEKPAHHLVVNILLAGVNYALQEEVALLQLVIEEQVDVAEEEIVHAQLLHGALAQHIGAGEEPAASAALLVADARVLHFHIEVGILGLFVVLVHGHLLYAYVADGIAQRLLGRSACVASLQRLQHLWGDVCLCPAVGANGKRQGTK